ncbi:MAG: FHA domain-containing protein [Chloroflexota bacterium]|nr:FHA domain-containing protein [Chloroflexota bacterium]
MTTYDLHEPNTKSERDHFSNDNDVATLVISQEIIDARGALDAASNRLSFDCGIRLKLQANSLDFFFVLISGQTVTVGRELFGDALSLQAARMGISRQHVVIANEGNVLTIMDLNSTNGTLLNQLKLMPHQKRILRYGDILQLGNLIVKVYFSATV